MAATARIDELRSKFDDNPRRYFAPLANEYRKAGDLGTAIAICRTQLRQFPTHMSGHVVFGQALFEAGEVREAREVFARAVELDPENLIALRHLGDLARDAGDRDAATAWYRRVLDADPSNAQIASILSELAAPPASEPLVESAAAETEAPRASIAFDDPVRSIEASPGVIDAAEPAEAQFPELSFDELRWAPPGAAVEPVEGFAGQPAEPRSQADEASDEEAVGQPDTFEFVDDWVGAGAPSAADPSTAPNASEPMSHPVVGLDLPVAPADDPALAQIIESDIADPPSAAGASTGAEAAPTREDGWPDDEPAALDVVPSDAFATETMAELCLEQGLDEQALAIFDRLLAQRPGDSALAARVDAVRARVRPAGHAEAAAAEPTAADYLSGLADVSGPTDEPAAVAADGSLAGASDDSEALDAAKPDADRGPALEDPPLDRAAREPTRADVTTAEATPTDAVVAESPDEAAAASHAASHAASERDEWAARAWADAFRSDVESDSALADLMDRVDGAPGASAFADEATPPTTTVVDDLATETRDDGEVRDEEAEDLSFDRFFVGLEASPSRPSDPLPHDAPAAQPSERPPAADRMDDGAWRDEWVAAPSLPPPPAGPPAAPVVADSPEDEADLAEFNAWLRGLRDS